MALTRKFLTALGIEADKIDEIITAHAETVEGLKEQRDSFKADAEKLADVQAKLAEVQEALDTAKKDAEKLPEVQKQLDDLKETAEKNSEFEQKYTELKTEYDGYKADQETKAVETAKKNAYRDLLIGLGVSPKRVASILKVTDLSKIELDNDGKIKDESNIVESVKNEWNDFIPTENQKGAETSTPPEANGGSKMTKEEIMKIKDTSKRQAAIAENHELFGF